MPRRSNFAKQSYKKLREVQKIKENFFTLHYSRPLAKDSKSFHCREQRSRFSALYLWSKKFGVAKVTKNNHNS